MKNLLWLTDVKGSGTVPLIPGWTFQVEGDTGCLKNADGVPFAQYDLSKETIQFVPDGEVIQVRGLTARLAQDVAEDLGKELLFSPEECAAYDSWRVKREELQKQRDQDIRSSLTGVIQLELREGEWSAHVNTEKLQELSGIAVKDTMAREEGISLFNEAVIAMGGTPIRDPTGYMACSGNVYQFFQQEYRNQYEDMLQGVDNQVIDGTGYGLDHVLLNLQSTIRTNVKAYCLPKRELSFGDLRFVPATEPQKKAIHEFVHARVSKTLIYEKRRSYEPTAIKRADDRYEQAGAQVKALLTGIGVAPIAKIAKDVNDGLSL